MSAMASPITSLTIVYSAVYSGKDERKHQSSASLAFVWEIHRWPVNSPRKGPVTRKMSPFDDVIMIGSGIFVIYSITKENANIFLCLLKTISNTKKVQGHTVFDGICCIGIGMLRAGPKLLREVSSATHKIVYGDWSWLTRLKMGI